METERVKLGGDGDLGNMCTDTLLRLFDLLPNKFCAQIWEDLSDHEGHHAKAMLRKNKKHPLRAELAPLLWPRLQGYLEVISKTDRGRGELLDMELDELFLAPTWPYILASMGNRLCIRDPRLVGFAQSQKTMFTSMLVTPVTLAYARDLVHPALSILILEDPLAPNSTGFRELILACREHISVIHVQLGIVPTVLEILHDCLPQSRSAKLSYQCPNLVSFREMQWVASWWLESKEDRVEIQLQKEPTWYAAIRSSRPTCDISSRLSEASSPANEPAALTFSSADAKWLRDVVDQKKATSRRNTMTCPQCHAYDPVARHLLVGRGYMCKFRQIATPMNLSQIDENKKDTTRPLGTTNRKRKRPQQQQQQQIVSTRDQVQVQSALPPQSTSTAQHKVDGASTSSKTKKQKERVPGRGRGKQTKRAQLRTH